MTDKLISVVFPVYNDISHLDRSVGAILNQTYRNLEIILTDDGSTDGSGDLCEKFAEADSRVRVFHKPNGGHSSAVNYGLERMTGEYVMICDTDDWYEPDACETALRTIENHPETDAVIFSMYRPDKTPVEDPASLVSFDKETIACMLLTGNTADFCHIGFHVESTWSKIVRADIIRKYHIHMPERLFLAEDAVFCLHLFEHCRKVIFDSHHIYHYEIRFDSFCRKFSDIAVKMLPEILIAQDDYIKKYHDGERNYISANNLSVFTWLNEAEDHYFFNEQQEKDSRVIFAEYNELLNNRNVYAHIRDIRPGEMIPYMKKIRLFLYRHPSYPVFMLYKKMKTRGK